MQKRNSEYYKTPNNCGEYKNNVNYCHGYDSNKDYYTKKEIDEIIALTKASLLEAIKIEEERAKRAEEANAKTIADILNENTGILS